MYIKLKNVKPIPIMDRLSSSTSDIWATDCHLKKGKKYWVTAPSGKGKSTLIHILYGTRKDYEGEVEVNQKIIKNFKPNDWSVVRQQQFSIVFQDLRLFLDKTGLENIQLKATLQPTKTEQEIREMALDLDVVECLDKPCGKLSYGQRQRIAIIRSLCQPFDFLLLDEPFSHLDDGNIKKASTLIAKVLKEQEAGLIIVSLGEEYYFKYDQKLIL